MLYRSSIGAIMLATALGLSGANAFDESQYPDWSGQWQRPVGVGFQWDPSKPMGRGQQAPLTAEYQAVFEASLADQAAGGQGGDPRYTCLPSGMPRVMTGGWPTEFVILPKITYVYFETNMPRRIYTDGRAFPTDEEPSFMGYSIGRWLDQDGDGRLDTLEVETRNFKGPRSFDPSGIPLHKDNQTVVKERIYLNSADPNILHDEVTTIDNALTRPWTVIKNYHRVGKPVWVEAICAEGNQHVRIGTENYMLSADGYLMPAKKGQAPPDLRYFDQARK
jgi:hypothetical protein